MPRQNQRMIENDEKSGYAKTSLKMTRSMSNDIALSAKKILSDIDENKVDLNYSEWQEFVSYYWSDEIWIDAINKAINMANEIDLDLNKNGAFLKLISTRTFPELKKEMKKKHPIAGLSLMDAVLKKPPEPEPVKKVKDLWP